MTNALIGHLIKAVIPPSWLNHMRNIADPKIFIKADILTGLDSSKSSRTGDIFRSGLVTFKLGNDDSRISVSEQ